MRLRSVVAPCAMLILLSCRHAGGAPAPGSPAPAFSLKDLTGGEVRLSDLKGKVVLLNFSTTWCPHCRRAVPALNRIAAAYKGKEFALYSIHIQESRKKVSSFSEKYDVSYPILLDEDGKVAGAYGVRGIPSRTIIGADGKVVCRDCADFESELARLLGPVAPAPAGE